MDTWWDNDEVLFIRHGKTQWNLDSRYQGANGDSPLLPQSYQEIKLLAKSLAGVSIAHIFSSPLPRAKTTATKLKEALGKNIPLTIDDRLALNDWVLRCVIMRNNILRVTFWLFPMGQH